MEFYTRVFLFFCRIRREILIFNVFKRKKIFVKGLWVYSSYSFYSFKLKSRNSFEDSKIIDEL